MTVYVDDMRAKVGRMIMCHMLADSDEELHAMADNIGVARHWHQKAGTEQSHYDICLQKRAMAIECGAVEITMREAVVIVQKKRLSQSNLMRTPSQIQDHFMNDGLDQLTRAELITELRALKTLVNSPHTLHFLESTRLETVHQIQRWGTVHDRAKEPQDWYWLLAYLSGKALRASIDGDHEKAKHHCISSAAVLANWHAAIALVDGRFAPGDSDIQQFLMATFGNSFLDEASEK